MYMIYLRNSMRHRWRLLDHVESTVCSLLKCVRLFI
ncbi:unnamed protein product [Arabidopsis lyrata]|nr:unnamed protein product [Arabidopsis lyrata]